MALIEENNEIPNICASYDIKRYVDDIEYKNMTNDKLKKITGLFDINVKSSAPFHKVFQRTPQLNDIDDLLPPLGKDGTDIYSKEKKDFSIILDRQAHQGPISINTSYTKSEPSGLGEGVIEKFRNNLEEVYVKIALNDSKIKVLLAQYEQIDAYFFSILSRMDEVAAGSAFHTSSSHDITTINFLESIGLKDYTPLGNTTPSDENTLALFETLDEIKSDNKLYRYILKANGRKYD
jgi:hypothetical protein